MRKENRSEKDKKREGENVMRLRQATLVLKFRSFLYCFKPPHLRPAAAPPPRQAVGASRPRCRTGPFGTRLATVTGEITSDEIRTMTSSVALFIPTGRSRRLLRPLLHPVCQGGRWPVTGCRRHATRIFD
jgi:hypothetical protein